MALKLLNELISTDYGLMSLVVILIIIIMAGYFTTLFMGKIGKSSAEQAKKSAETAAASKQ